MSDWKEIRNIAIMYSIAAIIYIVIMAGITIGICLIVKWIFF